MIVRESMRGYALLRSIGASPAQVFSTVIVQAVVLGLVGSGTGSQAAESMKRSYVANDPEKASDEAHTIHNPVVKDNEAAHEGVTPASSALPQVKRKTRR